MRPVLPVRAVAEERLALLDWKRRIFDLYREVRADDDPARAWNTWRTVRDDLIANHSQSPVDQSRREDVTPSYFDYDPAARVLARVEPLKLEHAELPMSRDDGTHFTRFGNAVFELHGSQLALGLYWLEAYGGGVFLSFTDETSGDLTYGAGRYLLDTVKGADLGAVDGKLVLDFNFAFNPSCAYDPKWACPLAPPENRLPVAVRAGERRPAFR
ncbi:MAG TPA: DUF1684 domain-containing protein [Gaiellaceae bacterium]|nr:DUF1684 domain-containing protein [Gaiellaceae bacterium]